MPAPPEWVWIVLAAPTIGSLVVAGGLILGDVVGEWRRRRRQRPAVVIELARRRGERWKNRSGWR
jgi:hypothetical protein